MGREVTCSGKYFLRLPVGDTGNHHRSVSRDLNIGGDAITALLIVKDEKAVRTLLFHNACATMLARNFHDRIAFVELEAGQVMRLSDRPTTFNRSAIRAIAQELFNDQVPLKRRQEMTDAINIILKLDNVHAIGEQDLDDLESIERKIAEGLRELDELSAISLSHLLDALSDLGFDAEDYVKEDARIVNENP